MANTLTFANDTLTDANIFGGINYTVDLNTGDEFSIGNTASACVSFVTDTRIPLYTKDHTNGTFVWDIDGTDKGRFYITEVKKVDSGYEIEAYDAMSLLDVTIQNLSISYPITAYALALQIATYMGCTVSGTIYTSDLAVSSLDPLMSIRQVLGYIAEASGCSVKVGAGDLLCFMYYEDSGVTITASDYVSLTVADYTCSAIDNVTIFNSAGAIQATAGSGSNSLFIGQNPFLEEATNTHAQTILSKVSGFSYVPLECNLFDDNDVEVGTIVTFGTTPTLVMHVESSEDGAVASSVGNDARGEYNKSAIEVVGEARAIAVDAQAMADIATGLLADMQDAATAAGTTLEGIYQDAEDAKESAQSALDSAQDARNQANISNVYANSALDQLGIVENIVGVLDLLQKHGSYQLTADTEVQDRKWYFTRSGSDPDYIYSIVASPTGDPSAQGWYELTGIDEAIQNYVSSQLAVDDDGLWLKTAGMQTKVLLSPDEGVVLYGTEGVPIGKYGATAQIGDPTSFHIEIDGQEIGFYMYNDKVAYMRRDALYVENNLSFGHFLFTERANGHFTLKLID